MRVIIVAGSPQVERPPALQPADGDLIVAADLGAAHCLRWGWQPDVVVGDLDSLPYVDEQILRDRGSPFITVPARKDETDLELALRYALQAGPQQIIIVGVLGGRIDHTLGNIMLLARPDLADRQICMMDGNQTVYPVRPGHPLALAGRPGDILSLIPVGGDARGVVARHVEWPLAGETLTLGEARGVSNVFAGPCAEVSLAAGLLLAVHIAASI